MSWKIKVKEYQTFIDVSLHLDLAILNSSHTVVDMNLFGKVVEKQLKTAFEIDYWRAIGYKRLDVRRSYFLDNFPSKPIYEPVTKRVKVKLEVSYRVITDMSERIIGEHLLQIKNKDEMLGLYGRVSEIGGLEVYINEKKVANIVAMHDRNTIPHEFGHTLGLKHIDINTHWLSFFGKESEQYLDTLKQKRHKNNMMFSGRSKFMNDSLSVEMLPSQVELIIKKYSRI